MHRCLAPGSCPRKRTLLVISLVWFAGGCGPGAATPMPEPPSILPNLLGPPTDEAKPVAAGTQGLVVDIEGGPGAAPANATIRVTDLDKTDKTYSTTALADGHFVVSVAVDYNDELRFEWLQGDKRSLPTDVLFLQVGTSDFRLQPSPRFDCVTLKPGFVLDFNPASTASVTLEIDNGCTADVSIDALSLRKNLPDFVLPMSPPPAFSPGKAANISISYGATGSVAVEDTLFVQLTEGGTTIRYPVTLSAGP